jgi:hypothetical protein
MNRLCAVVLILQLASPCAWAVRCGNRLVVEGAQDFQVRDRCGDPFWTDSYVDLEVLGADSAFERLREIRYDIWYYNFGPDTLMRGLVFHNGVLVREDLLGYGVRRVGGNCDPNRDYVDLSAGELVAYCGEPASRRRQPESTVERPFRGAERWHPTRREDWIYDFGESRLLRRMSLVDGRVRDTDRLAR